MPFVQPGGGGGGGRVTEDVYIPAVALFEHPEDSTTLFEAVVGNAEGLTVTLGEPLEYGQQTDQWSIVGAQRYQGVAEQDASITGATFTHTRYLGEHTTANAPARDALTELHVFYDTTLGLFQVGDDGVDWRNITSQEWQAIFGTANLPWNPTGGWANDLGTANSYEYADQDAIEASLTANYARWTGGQYGSSEGVLWVDQSAGDVKTFGAVTPAVEGVDADPVHVVVDRENTQITAYYNLAAGGALTEADTLGDLKGAFDTAAEGLSSEYVGGGDMDTSITRPFATISQFSAADLRGLRLALTDPIAAGIRGNDFGLVARARFPGGAEVTERQAHILIYTNTGRSGGIRVTLNDDIQGLNEHGVPVDVSSGALGNEWHFVTRAGQDNNETVSVSPANRQIIFTSNRLGLDETFASQVLTAINRGGTGVTATTFGGYGSSRHVFRGSLGDLNASINRFHDGRDYHAATATPEPITITAGPTHAHTRLYTSVDGGILLSLVDPAHDAGNGFSFESVEGDPLGVEVAPTHERITLTIPTAGALASAVLATFNADDALEASYFGTEDGSTNVLHSRFGRHEMLGGLDATEIEVLYAPEATGGIANPDTMGDVKTAWDAIDGLISFYYNGADANTVASRLTPWEHEFENGDTQTINLSGFGLGPEQNEFTGADRAAAEAARDTYAAANPTWVEAYRGHASVWIVLRWGTTPGEQIGQVLRENATNPPTAGDWIDQNLALRGAMGQRGIPGPSTAVKDFAQLGGRSIEPSDADTAFTLDSEVKPYALVGGRSIEPSDADATFTLDSEVKPYALVGGRLIEPSDADTAFMLDAEFTVDAVRTLLSLTQTELDSLLIGDNARIDQNILVIPQNDGTDLRLTLPQVMAGTADGVISGITFAADASSMTISRTEGADITVNIPASLRAVPRTDAEINALRGNRLMLSTSTTYDEANDRITIQTAFVPALGDQITFLMPANVAQAAGNLMMRYGTGASLAFLDRDGNNLTASDVQAGRLYSVIRFSNDYRILEAPSDVVTPPAQMHLRYAAIRTADNSFTAADFTAAEATTSQTNTIDTPDTDDAAFLAFAIPDSVNDLSDIRQEGGLFSYFGSFTLSNTLITLDGEDHKVYISNFALDAALIGDNWVLTPSP